MKINYNKLHTKPFIFLKYFLEMTVILVENIRGRLKECFRRYGRHLEEIFFLNKWHIMYFIIINQ